MFNIPDLRTLAQLFLKGGKIDTKIISLYIEILVRDQSTHCCLRLEKQTNEPRVITIPSESLFLIRDSNGDLDAFESEVAEEIAHCTESGAKKASIICCFFCN